MLEVIIIDKRPVLRFGLKNLLEHRYEKITIRDFASFEDCARSKQIKGASLLFIGVAGNLHLEEMPGFIDLKRILPHVHLIIYDTVPDIESCIRYVRQGVHGYLSASSDFSSFEGCVETVKNGKLYIDPVYQSYLIEGLINKKWDMPKSNNKAKTALTSRQNEIAQLFAQGLTTSAVARKLGLQASTISTVKSKIYAKLKVDSIVDLSKKVSATEWKY